ncbi:hypothetical protein ACFLWA_09115 [Chloroflexota bacterium]
MKLEQLISDSRHFLGWLIDWYSSRPTLDLGQAIENDGSAGHFAVMAVDVTNGFCHSGPLSSKRVGGIVVPVVNMFARAHELGVQQFVLPQDTHSRFAEGFSSFAPHCVAGTAESETVGELMTLPFSHLFTVI